MTSSNPGHKFEKSFAGSLNGLPNWFCIRLNNNMSGFKSVSNVCDYIIYKYPYIILAELKSYKGKSIPLTGIRQRDELNKYRDIKGVFPLIICNFRDLEETYAINVTQLDLIIDRKSISIDFARKSGIRIEQKLIRTNYKYNLANLDIYLTAEVENNG